MVLECIVKGCEVYGKNNFHSFPANKSSAEKWIFATKAFHLEEKLNTNKLSNSFHKVCRRHFAASDLTKNGKGQIVVKTDAIPTLFLPNDIDLQGNAPWITRPMKPVKRLHQQDSSTGKTSSEERVQHGTSANDENAMNDKTELHQGGGQIKANRSRGTVRGYMLVVVCCLFCIVL